MKTVLEVILDDDGKMKFKSECPFGLTKEDFERDPEMKSPRTLAKIDESFKVAIEGFVESSWKDRDESIYPIIRLLSMAEIMATSQPYAQAEHYWSSMMFSLIPRMEGFADTLKAQYGFRRENVNRPFRWVNPEFADLLGVDISMNRIDEQGLFCRPESFKTPIKWS